MKINNEEPLLKIVDTYTLYERHDYKKSNSRKDVQFCCDQCDFKSKWPGAIKRHIDSAHGDMHTLVISVIIRQDCNEI